MSDSFKITNEIGNRGMHAVRRVLESKRLRCHVIGENRLSIDDELILGDLLVTRPGGEVRSIEVKTETDYTGNLFLEVWSNRRAGRPGWLETGDYNLLAWLFESNGLLLIYRFQELKSWANGPSLLIGSGHLRRVEDFDLKEAKKYVQANDTWGYCVPIDKLEFLHPTRYRKGVRQNAQTSLFDANEEPL